MNIPESGIPVMLALSLVVVVAVSAAIWRWWHVSPFRYPYFRHEFDVTGRRNVDISNLIDRFLCSKENRDLISGHERTVRLWKKRQDRWIRGHRFRKHRTRQYEQALDDAHAFRFTTVRQRTRYRQENYKRIPYKVEVEDDVLAVDAVWLKRRIERLGDIGFESTLKDYRAKNQRRLMTPALRRSIMERDDYTCQQCGKRMRDGVGLHIDHIIPVAKGGKSVPSNLQVLCSKCNGRKGDRLPA